MPVNSQTRTKLDKKSLVSRANGTSSLANLRSLVEALELESLTLTGDLVVTGSVTAGSIAGANTFADGTVGAPSIAFTGSLTTGLYQPSADTIGVAIGGAQDFLFAANTLTAVSGSTIATNTIAETTAAAGVTIDGVLLKDATVFVDTISEKTVGVGVTIDSVELKDGGVKNSANTQIAAFYPQVSQNNIAAAAGGAIPVTNYFTTINTDAGGDAFTLANGAQIGQMKKILLVVDGGGDGVVTPATALAGGTTITFDDAGDYVILQWSGAAWVVLENSGVAVA